MILGYTAAEQQACGVLRLKDLPAQCCALLPLTLLLTLWVSKTVRVPGRCYCGAGRRGFIPALLRPARITNPSHVPCRRRCAQGGVAAMALSAAASYAPKNIRVNCVAPGLTRTKMTERITSEGRALFMLCLSCQAAKPVLKLPSC